MPTVYQSVTVVPGTSAYIPKNAVIVAVNRIGDSDVESDCMDLTAPSFECFAFYYSIGNAGGGPTGVLEDDDVHAESIEIAGTVYAIDRDSLQDVDLLLSALASVTPLGMVNYIDADTVFTTADRQDLRIRFKTAPAIAATMKLKLVGAGYPNLYVLPESTDCPPTTPPVSG